LPVKILLKENSQATIMLYLMKIIVLLFKVKPYKETSKYQVVKMLDLILYVLNYNLI